jgi:serine/threonine protein kinase/tetratricopeptide (TPR) repeat protein
VGVDLPVRFGKYELLLHLATGGMAEVFLARSFGAEGFEKKLVIKKILPELARSQRFVSMFIQEARISASMNHPNIVQIYELGKVGDDHYIAMEHIHGRDLTQVGRALRREGGRFPLHLAVHVVTSLLRGLGYAHALTDPAGRPLHLVHRDVSPHNILLSFEGEVKLFDFGVARLLIEGVAEEEGPGRGGKFAYMSPEQAAGQSIDRRADIYAAGVVLYELLVGHRLFHETDADAKLKRVLAADVPDPRIENPEIPDALWSVLQRMLCADPAGRPGRAEEAEEDLWDFLYRSRMRADAPALRGFLRGLFAEESAERVQPIDLEGLLADLRRVPAAPTRVEATVTTHSGQSNPEELDTARIRAPEGERKGVVVLVAEVVGFTDASARLDIEEVVRRHERFLKRVRATVERFGGVVQRAQDDTLVVFFGVPRAGEHDLERALETAMGLLAMARRAGRDGLPVSMGIGVHRGDIAVGAEVTEGGGDVPGYLAQGDTMKLALRLCLEAEEGQIVVSERVAALCGDRFRFAPGPEFRLKGHKERRRAFLLVGGRRRDLPATGEWLRRGREVDVLRAAIESLARGRGGLLSILGGAGSGKSRLLRELMALARQHGVPLFVGRAAPWEGDRPLGAFRELLANVIGAESGDTEAQLRERLGRLKQIGVGDADRAVLGSIFGLDPGKAPREGSGAAFARAARSLVGGLAQDRPVIFALEDAQHLDLAAINALAAILAGTHRERVVFLLTSRAPLPEALGTPDWEIHLGRLPLDLVAAFVRGRVGADAVAEPLLQMIHRTAEGNPLYIEAVVGALLQTGRAQVVDGIAEIVDPDRDIVLPPGLEALLTARVDDLGADRKGLLQLAAAIGSTFSVRLLSASAGGGDPARLLGELAESGFLVREEDDSGDRYSFASSLLWEVVQRPILGARRRELHGMIVVGMEQLHAGHLDLHRVALARHAALAGRPAEAAAHALRAGELYFRQPLLDEATRSWDRGLAWLEEAREAGAAAGELASLEATLCWRLGAARALLGEPRVAERHLQVALDLASDLADAELEANVHLELGTLYLARGGASLARANLEAAIAVCEGRSGPWRAEVLVAALEGVGKLAHDQGDDAAAARAFERALTEARGEPALMARALLGLAGPAVRGGEEARALSLLGAAEAAAREANDRILLGRVLNNTGLVHLVAERFGVAIERFREALDLRKGLGYRQGMATNLHNIGDAWFRQGEAGRAWAAFTQSRELAVSMGWEVGVVMNDPFLALLDARRLREEGGSGKDDEAVAERIVKAGKRLFALQDKEGALTAQWLLAQHHRDCGAEAEARATAEAALRDALALGARWVVRDLERALAPPEPR